MTDLSREFAAAAVAKLNAETERWCWKAIAKGVGWRVWRSDATPELDANGHRMTYQFQLLPPGHAAPASGWIFGPFSQADDSGEA
ncbi:MAG: hypothetical protein ACOY5R_06770 [Pseudomonadota bacterium]